MKIIVKFLIFVAIMLTVHFMVQTPTITSNFVERATRFHVLGENNDGYQILSLSEALKESSSFNFHLSKVKIRLDGRKKHTIEILEDTGNKQRVRYLYSGTAKTESIYDVVGNKVIPVRYKVISSVGNAFVYMFAFIISLFIIPIVSRVIFWAWTKNIDKKA